MEHFGVALEQRGSGGGGRIMVMGGRTTQGNAKLKQTAVEIFDFRDGRWRVAPFAYRMDGFTPSLSPDTGKVAIFGAELNEKPVVYSFNAPYDRIGVIGNLAAPRRFPTAVGLGGGTYLVFGGVDQYNQSVNSVELYRSGDTDLGPAPGYSTSYDRLSLQLRQVSAAQLPSGKVFVVGTTDRNDNRWTTFDFGSKTSPPSFSNLQMFPIGGPVGRAQVAYSPLHKKILVLIEQVGLGDLSAFFVDPTTYAWSAAPTPPAPFRSGTALVGSEAGFFLIGGTNQSGALNLVHRL